MAMRLVLLGFAFAAISPAIARSVEYRWTSGPGMGGTITAAIVNAAGSAFRIYCATGGDPPRGGFEYETKRAALRENERVQIVVGKKSFVLTSGPNMGARGSRIELSKLVGEMIKTRAKFFLVEVPRTKFAEQFSLRDAATHLKNEIDGSSIYEPCL
jgi:hypothetical protein